MRSETGFTGEEEAEEEVTRKHSFGICAQDRYPGRSHVRPSASPSLLALGNVTSESRAGKKESLSSIRQAGTEQSPLAGRGGVGRGSEVSTNPGGASLLHPLKRASRSNAHSWAPTSRIQYWGAKQRNCTLRKCP